MFTAGTKYAGGSFCFKRIGVDLDTYHRMPGDIAVVLFYSYASSADIRARTNST